MQPVARYIKLVKCLCLIKNEQDSLDAISHSCADKSLISALV